MPYCNPKFTRWARFDYEMGANVFPNLKNSRVEGVVKQIETGCKSALLSMFQKYYCKGKILLTVY